MNKHFVVGIDSSQTSQTLMMSSTRAWIFITGTTKNKVRINLVCSSLYKFNT